MTATPATAGAPGSVAAAIASMVCAVALFATMNAMIKSLGDTYPVSQIVFFRSLFALVVLWPMIWRAGGWKSLKTERPWGHAWRCAAGVSAMTCGFTAITLLPLAQAAAFSFTAPLWTTLLGVLLLGERVRWRRTVALVVGFLGVLLMLRPDSSLLTGLMQGDARALGSLLGVTSAILAALAMISIRRLSTSEPSTTIVFYFMVTGVVASGLALPFHFVLPDLPDLVTLVTIGLVGGVAQVLLTRAYRGAPVAVVAPFDYTAMVWATGYGYLIWGELPDSLVILGALVVVGSGVYITLREVKLGVPRPRETTPAAKGS